jgi:hypothetical protein
MKVEKLRGLVYGVEAVPKGDEEDGENLWIAL